VVEVSSRTLYELLKKPVNIDRVRQYVEYCIGCVCAFLRGFSNSEGCAVKNGNIYVFNSDKSLLEYINDLLNRLGIKQRDQN
jgi:intein-encoded DNA endonuclease-like protein